MPQRRLAVFFVAATALCLCALDSGAQSGKSAPADLPVVDVNGYQKVIAERQGKVILVNFWATWCPPCRTEYPELNIVAREFEKQGVVVVGMNQDDDAELNLVRRFLEKNQPIFKNYRVKPGIFTAFTKSLNAGWRGSLPTSFLYARDGKVAARLDGPHTREEFAQAIRLLLARESGGRPPGAGSH